MYSVKNWKLFCDLLNFTLNSFIELFVFLLYFVF